MAYTVNAISGQPEKNAGGTILNAGSSSNSETNALTVRTALANESSESKVVDITGVDPLISGRRFASMAEGEYIGTIIGTKIAGTTDNTLRSGASHHSQPSMHYARGWRRKHLTGFNILTGAATYGGNAGDLSTYIDPVSGSAQAVEPYPTNAVPGEFVYHEGKALPTQDDYQPRTNG